MCGFYKAPIIILCSCNFAMQNNGKHISWKHLRDLYAGGIGATKEAPGLSLVPKLKYEHVFLTSFSKMRVDLAAQVSSLK